ncbi:MAG: hypothetical protein E6Q98_02975 [Rhodospirillaceae bacterium]|nr:MAG: hypothetical protein E6Q98_02975 [Rhodospirillaceae bacterium]
MLSLMVGGQLYEGWTEVAVTRSVENAVSTFDLGLSERWARLTSDGSALVLLDQSGAVPWRIQPCMPCEILMDGETVITGYVDSYNPTYSASDHSVRVTGRSRTADIADCSAIVPGGQFTGYDLGQIARTLCATVGVGVDIETDLGAPFPDVQVQQGETIFELIERLSRLRAVLVRDAPSGNLVLARAGKGRAAGSLRQGVNILSASATLSAAERYSDYIVKGQQAATDAIPGTQATEPIGKARDPGITRYRPKLVIAEGQTDIATAVDRATWEKLTRAANGVRATITVQDWRDPNSGRLWAPNEMAYVDSSWLAVQRDLLIAGVTYRLSEGGTTCELSLAPPEAYTPEPVDPSAAANLGGAFAILDQKGVLSPPVGKKERPV